MVLAEDIEGLISRLSLIQESYDRVGKELKTIRKDLAKIKTVAKKTVPMTIGGGLLSISTAEASRIVEVDERLANLLDLQIPEGGDITIRGVYEKLEDFIRNNGLIRKSEPNKVNLCCDDNNLGQSLKEALGIKEGVKEIDKFGLFKLLGDRIKPQ